MFESIWQGFLGLHPVMQAFIAGGFGWAMNALGAATVFGFRHVSRKMLDAMLGFAGGVMIAASCWSLLNPAIEMAEGMGVIPWVPALVGFSLGGVAIRVMDRFVPHLHAEAPMNEVEGVQTNLRKPSLLLLAMTLHNIPEGLAVGVAFGGLALGIPEATLGGAMALGLGIGIQNFPEGTAVSVSLRREGMPVGKAFNYGQASALVEPVFAVIGAALVMVMAPVLPYALSFAAGAMIFVVIEEVIPEAQRHGNTDLATLGGMAGFAVMMTLDVALG